MMLLERWQRTINQNSEYLVSNIILKYKKI